MQSGSTSTLHILAGKTALVTGGTGGIGLSCATALVNAGIKKIAINGRSVDRATNAASRLAESGVPAEAFAVAGDVSQAEGAASVVAAAAAQLGQIDIVINSTGGDDIPALLARTPIEEIHGMLGRTMLGQILVSRAVLPKMMDARTGCIINIASDAAKIPTPGESIIGAAMAAIAMFTRCLAVEGKRHSIRANVLTPSIVRGTSFYERLMSDEFSGKLFRKAEQMASLGVVEKEDLAELVVFLASPQASKITGQTISITGGISAA